MRKILTRDDKFYLTKVYVCLFVAILIIFVAVSIYFTAEKNKMFDKRSFYVLYADKYVSESRAGEMCDKVANLGGAGVTYLVGNTYFVVVNIYLNYDDALMVQQNNQSVFDCQILELSSPKLFKKSCSTILGNDSYKNFYQFFVELYQNAYSLMIGSDLGEISTSEVYKSMMIEKQNLIRLCNSLDGDTCKIGLRMYESGLAIYEHIEYFFDSAFVSNITARPLKKLYANLVFEWIDLCQKIK